MTTLYVAGPMTGLPEFNYPAFNEAAAALRAEGYAVLCPTEIDHEDAEAGAKPWEWYMRRTLAMLLQADHVATLPNWFMSRGAQVEVDLARMLGMRDAPVVEWLVAADQEVTP